MEPTFYQQNRKNLLDKMNDNSLAIFFSGIPVHKTNDEFYPAFANRNFVYLTGITQLETILLLQKSNGTTKEQLFILPSDLLIERWNGKRIKAHEAQAISGITEIDYQANFATTLQLLLRSGLSEIYLDLDDLVTPSVNAPAMHFCRETQEKYPFVTIQNANPFLRTLRTIKRPEEIAALKKAESITQKGIIAMMEHARSGLTEYQLKAEFNYLLTKEGVLQPAWDSIVSSGENNFCIHYNSGFDGLLKDGDMILNDVGASYNHLITDVSRAYPVNGKFSERQKELYQITYEVSEEMFRLIKPGMLHQDIDRLIKEKITQRMLDLKILDKAENIGTYMWHGGAHHIGFNVHDAVTTVTELKPGMCFCVDLGIYHEEWGIGFRLEDNCVITETGCENLSKEIPRKIADIENIVGRAYY